MARPPSNSLVNKISMNQSYTSAAALAADESFISWVKKDCPPDDAYWCNWIQAHTGRQALAEEARTLVLLLSADTTGIRDGELEQVWQNLQQARERQQRPGEARILPFRWFQPRIAAAAAGLLALAGGLALYQSYFQAPLVYATAYGEKRTILLPDNSTVMLNAHSKISVPRQWGGGDTREVYLEGEAFFTVQHTSRHQKFLVHTTDGLQVEVLGTAFNVSDRGEVNRVVLAAGKVQLKVAAAGTTGQAQQIDMVPGQLVEMSEKTRQLTKRSVDTERYTGWTQNRLVFDNTSLGEIARMLHQDYGLQVVFEDQALAALRLTASFEITGLDSILYTLAETFGIRIEKQQQKLIFSKPKVNQTNNLSTYAK
jgi:transmembrane sensor